MAPLILILTRYRSFRMMLLRSNDCQSDSVACTMKVSNSLLGVGFTREIFGFLFQDRAWMVYGSNHNILCSGFITLVLLSFECLLLCLQGYMVRKGCITLRELTMTFLNEIILDEIIENHNLKARGLRVNIPRALCAPARPGYTCTAPWRHSGIFFL